MPMYGMGPHSAGREGYYRGLFQVFEDKLFPQLTEALWFTLGRIMRPKGKTGNSSKDCG